MLEEGIFFVERAIYDLFLLATVHGDVLKGQSRFLAGWDLRVDGFLEIENACENEHDRDALCEQFAANQTILRQL